MLRLTLDFVLDIEGGQVLQLVLVWMSGLRESRQEEKENQLFQRLDRVSALS